MPYHIDWLVKDRVLLTTFSGVLTLDELIEFIDTIMLEIQQGQPMVHHVSNSLGMERVEFSLKTLQTLTRAKKIVDALGWQIDINRNPLLKMISGIASQFANARTRTFATADEAISFLKERDQTLADLIWKTELLKTDETIPMKQ
ncbi:MAG: hypothetical protein H7X77_02230 [Anaerolineae bacterium]|nr:hypothetical protein [Anaerolineae bacterium]